MNSKIVVSSDLDSRLQKVEKELAFKGVNITHPDVLFLDSGAVLGVETAKKIRQHLGIKPFSAKGRAVVVLDSTNMTLDAQNALLKTLEEPPENSLILLGVEKETDLLETIRSRCQIISLEDWSNKSNESNWSNLEGLAGMSLEERFEYVEKLEDKEGFLKALVYFYKERLGSKPEEVEFVKTLVNALKWREQNVNIRAILEYLMMRMPKE